MKECESCQRCFEDGVDVCPFDGKPTTPTLHGPPRLDRYELQQRIGKGGMGVVFKARHQYLNTFHALKIILPGSLAFDPKLASRFQQEARAVAAIRHRNVVTVSDYGVAGGTTPFLVMEFLKGHSLEELLAGGARLAPERALEIMSAAGGGVAAAHRLGIVHRDLKPQNIFIQDDSEPSGLVKVLDFGLAKVIVEGLLGSLKVDESSGVVGTPLYLAPEQWRREDPDERTDVYALGLILYRMLAGQLPFFGATPADLMHLHLREPPPPFASFGVVVPPRLEKGVRHALEKDRARRPPSVEAFIEELSAACGFGSRRGATIRGVAVGPAPAPEQAATARDVPLASTLRTEPPPPAPPQPPPESSPKVTPAPAPKRSPWAGLPSRLHTRQARGLLLGMLSAGLVLALLAYAVVLRRGPDGPPATPTPTPVVEPRWALGQVLPGYPSSVDAVAFSPSGDVLAAGSFNTTVRLWDAGTGLLIRSLAQPRDTQLLFALAFYGGGERVAAATGGGVRIFDARGGGEVARLTGHRGRIIALAPSTDGKLLAGGGADGEVVVWRVTDGQVQFTLKGSGMMRGLAFSPDSRTLAGAGSDGIVVLWDVRSGEESDRLRRLPASPVSALAFAPDGQTLAFANLDGDIVIRDGGAVAEPRTLERKHLGPVNALAFAPDGLTLASAGDDKRVLVWRVSDGRVLQELTHHKAEVNALAFAPDGRRLATGSRDRTAALLERAEAAGTSR